MGVSGLVVVVVNTIIIGVGFLRRYRDFSSDRMHLLIFSVDLLRLSLKQRILLETIV